MRGAVAVAVLAAAGAAAGGGASYAALSSRPAVVPAHQVEVISCHIEWDAAARKPVMDRSAGSGCTGVDRVWVDTRGRVSARHVHDPVISIDVTPDESAVSRGITAGASGGGATTMLTVVDTRLGRTLDLRSRADASRLGTSSGWWLTIAHDAR